MTSYSRRIHAARHARRAPRAYSLIGMLVTMVIIAILFTIGMTSLNKAVTGEGSSVEGTVDSTQDQMQLYALYQSMFLYATQHRDKFLVPNVHAHEDDDETLNTTAAYFSAVVMDNQSPPSQLISGNERSGYVWEDDDYDYTQYNPSAGVFWDPAFAADLDNLSNVSYAHMPLFGERVRRQWGTRADATMPLIGFRGPENGEDRPDSWTYGRNGEWGGFVVFGDGRIEWLTSFTPPSVTRRENGEAVPDNIFNMDEEGANGMDAIIAFTKEMTRSGPYLQYD